MKQRETKSKELRDVLQGRHTAIEGLLQTAREELFIPGAITSHDSYSSLDKTMPKSVDRNAANPLPPMSLILNNQKHAIKNKSVLKMSFPAVLPKIGHYPTRMITDNKSNLGSTGLKPSK